MGINRGNLGGHNGLAPRALTKHEVAALLCCRALEAGLWAIPEFEIRSPDGCKRCIDIVWATRLTGSADAWRPVAAFEIEGWGVSRAPKSLRKDVAALRAAADRDALVTAIVLFQVGPTGAAWRSPGTAESVMSFIKSVDGEQTKVEVVLDVDLDELLRKWVQIAVGV